MKASERAAKLQTDANELLRQLNAEVFNDQIDIEQLPYAVGLVEDFARHYVGGRVTELEQALATAAEEFRELGAEQCADRAEELLERQKENV